MVEAGGERGTVVRVEQADLKRERWCEKADVGSLDATGAMATSGLGPLPKAVSGLMTLLQLWSVHLHGFCYHPRP